MSKFCGKCGQPLEGTEKFCSGCGATVQAGTPVQATLAQMPTEAVKSRGKEFVNSSFGLVLITVAMQMIIMLTLRFEPFCVCKVSGVGVRVAEVKYSINDLLGKYSGEVYFAVACLVAVLFTALPVMRNALGKEQRLLIPKHFTFLNGLVIAGCVLKLENMGNNTTGKITMGNNVLAGSVTHWELTIFGWLNIVVTLTVVCLLFAISYKTKKFAKRKGSSN